MKQYQGLILSGAAAGSVNGFFGAGGGTMLIPLLQKTKALSEAKLFPGTLTIMIPICLTSLLFSDGPMPFQQALPYLAGSLLGGFLAGKIHLSPVFLHRFLGILILLGGGRMLWS